MNKDLKANIIKFMQTQSSPQVNSVKKDQKSIDLTKF